MLKQKGGVKDCKCDTQVTLSWIKKSNRSVYHCKCSGNNWRPL